MQPTPQQNILILYFVYLYFQGWIYHCFPTKKTYLQTHTKTSHITSIPIIIFVIHQFGGPKIRLKIAVSPPASKLQVRELDTSLHDSSWSSRAEGYILEGKQTEIDTKNDHGKSWKIIVAIRGVFFQAFQQLFPEDKIWVGMVFEKWNSWWCVHLELWLFTLFLMYLLKWGIVIPMILMDEIMKTIRTKNNVNYRITMFDVLTCVFI